MTRARERGTMVWERVLQETIKLFSVITSTITIVFWLGYNYRMLRSCVERLSKLESNQVTMEQDIENGDVESKNHATKIFETCSKNKVEAKDLAIFDTRLGNVIETQHRLEEQLSDLAGKFNAFTEYYYRLNRKSFNTDGG